MENGKVFNTNEEYHSGPGYSRSDLETIRKQSISHLEAKKKEIPNPTPSMEFGTAFHQLVLEPEKFYTYNISDVDKPVKPSFGRTKADQEAKNLWELEVLHQWEKKTEGMKIWKQEDWESLLEMKKSVMRNPIMNKVLTAESTLREVSYYWKDEKTGMLLKARPDIFYPELGLIIDLKSCTSANYNQFRRDLVAYSYDQQSAFYSDIVSKVEGTNKINFVFCCVEKTAPFGMALYRLDEASQEVGRELYESALKKLNNIDDNHTYPEYIQDINLAAYGFNVDDRY